MPTGYTAMITDRDGVTFPEFAMECARAFGALITMRDDPRDATIPEKFEPSSQHREALDKALAELLDLSNMTDDECRVAAEKEYLEALARYRDLVQSDVEKRAKYEAMLDQVLAWEPPTADHVELKAFMVQQIESSIRFDCDYQWPKPQRKDLATWRADKRAQVERDVAYHEKEDAAEVERANSRTAWVQQLRDSLAAS